ncbi:MAG: hypothetical protein VCB26_01800 [Candidatus Hydrogenedentota bacterium]
MDGIVSVGGVGAVASSAQIKAAHQAKAVALQDEATQDLGANALKLIQASFIPISTGVGSDLDVRV